MSDAQSFNADIDPRFSGHRDIEKPVSGCQCPHCVTRARQERVTSSTFPGPWSCEGADAFWDHLKANDGKHGPTESTWAAIKAALDVTGWRCVKK